MVYFYIFAREDLRDRFPKMRACWVRNLVPAPLHDDNEAMDHGISPMLAAQYCRNLEGEAPLDPSQIQILWNESDDGARCGIRACCWRSFPLEFVYRSLGGLSAGCIKENPLTFRWAPLRPTRSANWRKDASVLRDWQNEFSNPCAENSAQSAGIV